MAAQGLDIISIRQRVNYEVLLNSIKRIVARIRQEVFSHEKIKELVEQDKKLAQEARFERHHLKKLKY